MPKNMKPKDKWNIFIQTITGSKSIQVTDVNEQEIRFTANHDSLNRLNQILSNPNELRTSLIHALPTHGGNHVLPTSILQNINEFNTLQGGALLNRLISGEFLSAHGVNPNQFINSMPGISQFNIGPLKPFQLQQLFVDIKYIQSALSDNDRIADILINGAAPIDHEDDQHNISDFAQSILWLTSSPDNTHSVVFNHGLMMQNMQDEYDFGDGAFFPVVAAVEPSEDNQQQTFSIKRKPLLKNIHDALQTNVIFKQEEDDDLQPILFHQHEKTMAKSEEPILIHILIDISGSMREVFINYMINIRGIIKSITESIDHCEIVITTFESNISSTRFIDASNNYQAIDDFVSTLELGSSTNLNGALGNSIMEIVNDSRPHQNPVLLLFTDGEDTEKVYTNDQLVEKASNAMQSNAQFAMFSMGFGPGYDAAFFKLISEQCGFTHMHLDNVQDIEEHFQQYINGLGHNRLIYEFISGLEHHYEQCTANDVAISSKLIKKGGHVKYDGALHEVDIDYPDIIDGLTVRDVVGDGNCLFHAVVRQIHNTGAWYAGFTHDELRDLAAGHVVEHMDLYYSPEELALRQTSADVTKMFNNAEFADNILIQALADRLEVNIDIHHVDGHIVHVTREGQNYENTLHLLFHNIHYFSLENTEVPAINPSHREELNTSSVGSYHSIMPNGSDYDDNIYDDGLAHPTLKFIEFCHIS